MSAQYQIGEVVSFKDDIEMCGRVIAIEGPWLRLETEDPYSGEPRVHVAQANRCWKES